ncbi:hypothetical protein GKE82_23410 [Conexibacter sp. W3-3-2]|uniref:hypothetical protein n=1 Tax=Conexibacter sp. W3-3-2 TaxID=2675227 RepID=UPI0012B73F9C|nr:hypothetical protein [Conexibacter sp. W3-3-2]MTD47153.1 hypothetical protein [Conexibacter sp. W3-3-2]
MSAAPPAGRCPACQQPIRTVTDTRGPRVLDATSSRHGTRCPANGLYPDSIPAGQALLLDTPRGPLPVRVHHTHTPQRPQISTRCLITGTAHTLPGGGRHTGELLAPARLTARTGLPADLDPLSRHPAAAATTVLLAAGIPTPDRALGQLLARQRLMHPDLVRPDAPWTWQQQITEPWAQRADQHPTATDPFELFWAIYQARLHQLADRYTGPRRTAAHSRTPDRWLTALGLRDPALRRALRSAYVHAHQQLPRALEAWHRLGITDPGPDPEPTQLALA